MTKFRNIRVKMKGGKSRIQRAMVLASGKLKFVKNQSRSKTPPSVSTGRSKTTRRHTTMVRRFSRRGTHKSGKSLMRSFESLATVGALGAPLVAAALTGSSGQDKLYRAIHWYTGYQPYTQKWEPRALLNGWGPVAGFTLARVAYHKAMSLIRRL